MSRVLLPRNGQSRMLMPRSIFRKGRERVAKGDFGGTVNILGGMIFKGGMGGDYESVKGVSNEVLGLPKVTLDEAVKEALGDLAKKV